MERPEIFFKTRRTCSKQPYGYFFSICGASPFCLFSCQIQDWLCHICHFYYVIALHFSATWSWLFHNQVAEKPRPGRGKIFKLNIDLAILTLRTCSILDSPQSKPLFPPSRMSVLLSGGVRCSFVTLLRFIPLIAPDASTH